jgi:hypothetical protein
MNLNQKENDKLIERLGKITICIKNIYSEMTKNAYDEEFQQKYEEYLSMALEAEDKLYLKIGEKIYDDTFIRRINYKIRCNDYKDTEDIINRIMIYIAEKSYLNPFLSQEINPIERLKENIASIKNQVTMDYIKGLIIYLNEEITNTKNKRKKKKLIKMKNNIFYNYKLIASLAKNENKFKVDGRNRCLVFNQDENLVNSIYSEYALSTINDRIIYILTNKDTTIAEIELKSALSLLTDKEIFQVARSYEKSLESNSFLTKENPNNEIIINIIREFLTKEKVNIKRKANKNS